MSIDDGELRRLQEEIARLQVMNAGLRARLTEIEEEKRGETPGAARAHADLPRRAFDGYRSDR